MASIFSLTDPVEVGLTAEGITTLCDDGIRRAAEIVEEIRRLKDAPDAALTRDATIGAFDEMTHALQLAIAFPQLMSMAHPDAVVRDAAKTSEPKLEAFQTALYLDPDIAHVFERVDKLGLPLSAPDTRLLEFILRDYRRNGLKLDAGGQSRLRMLNEELTKIGQQFDVNLAEASLAIEIDPGQLAGLPESYVQSHAPQANGRVRVTTDYPDYIPFMKYATDRKAARELFILSANRACDKNLPILDRLIVLRKEKATLLGYPTWADYVLEMRMAKSAGRVRLFLDELHEALKKNIDGEMTPYLEMHQKLGGAADARIPASDSSYLHDLVAKERFSLDTQKLSEYFEVSAVRQGILDISSKLYGITFKHRADLPTWHAEVEAHDVLSSDGRVIGRVYFDLHPRADKYKHAAVFGIRDTRKLADGTRVMPTASLVCNFPKPGAAPALLSHDEATTFFHEFGHALHHVLSESDLASFAGTGVARDFVEAPSQMFEEWAWTRETLDLFAKHYKTSERLPDDMFEAMTAERHFGTAIFTERQLMLADLDFTYHTREPGFDTTAVMNEMQAKYSPFAQIPETHFQGTFGHLVGYDAGYYGYQWALSIAQDLFTRFKTEGMLNIKTADDYRKAILVRGGSEDENKLVENFLGRPGNADAYKEFLGIA